MSSKGCTVSSSPNLVNVPYLGIREFCFKLQSLQIYLVYEAKCETVITATFQLCLNAVNCKVWGVYATANV